jgi:hypothetical protein
MTTTLTREHAAIAIRALMLQQQALEKLLASQMQHWPLPPGCIDWMQTEDELRQVWGAIAALSKAGFRS